MKKSFVVQLISAVALMLTAGSGFAVPITATATTQVGTTYNATGLSGYQTYGDDMDGMRVTVFFNDQSSEVVAWTDHALLANGGSASGSDWYLEQSGNTDSASWYFENTGTRNIRGLRLEGLYGLTVFDYVPGPTTGSPGSDMGGNIVSNFSYLYGSDNVVVNATYRDQLQINGQFYGDLYLTLDLQFSGSGVGSDGGWLEFISDTDTIQAIPEPSTALLMSLGMIGIGFSCRRKS